MNTIQTFRGGAIDADHDAAMLAGDATRHWQGSPLQAWDLLRESHWLAMRGVASAPPLRDLLESFALSPNQSRAHYQVGVGAVMLALP